MPAMLDFARIWNPMPTIVFSTTLRAVQWNSRLVAGDVAAALSRVRAEFQGDLEVGGPTLAAAFIRRGLVDECASGVTYSGTPPASVARSHGRRRPGPALERVRRMAPMICPRWPAIERVAALRQEIARPAMPTSR